MTRVSGQSVRLALLASTLFIAGTASAKKDPPLSIMNGFRLGDAGVLCTAQVRPADPRLTGVFDRAYVLTCRDAASAVGSIIAVRRAVDIAGEGSVIRTGQLSCGAPASATIDNVGTVASLTCRDETSKLDYRRYSVSRGRENYLVEGLAGYDPALRLALASVVNNKVQSGSIQVATTEVGDAAAFARTQAGAFDPTAARTEAYARNNGGRFAESAEFFENLADREGHDAASRAEALANQGLQQSNMSNFAGAERLLAAADRASPKGNGVIQRLLRNYRAINKAGQRNGVSSEVYSGHRAVKLDFTTAVHIDARRLRSAGRSVHEHAAGRGDFHLLFGSNRNALRQDYGICRRASVIRVRNGPVMCQQVGPGCCLGPSGDTSSRRVFIARVSVRCSQQHPVVACRDIALVQLATGGNTFPNFRCGRERRAGGVLVNLILAASWDKRRRSP
jgi:hypothetical protein